MQGFKKWIFLLVIFLQFMACKKAKTSELLVSDEKMISILVDLHIAEAAILTARKTLKDSVGLSLIHI